MHQFGVEAARLSAAGVKAAVGGQISGHHHQLLFQRDQAGEVEEEGFARPVFADDEPDGGPAVADALDIADHLLDLAGAANLNVL